jgi:hypothetical protein
MRQASLTRRRVLGHFAGSSTLAAASNRLRCVLSGLVLAGRYDRTLSLRQPDRNCCCFRFLFDFPIERVRRIPRYCVIVPDSKPRRRLLLPPGRPG